MNNTRIIPVITAIGKFLAVYFLARYLYCFKFVDFGCSFFEDTSRLFLDALTGNVCLICFLSDFPCFSGFYF